MQLNINKVWIQKTGNLVYVMQKANQCSKYDVITVSIAKKYLFIRQYVNKIQLSVQMLL